MLIIGRMRPTELYRWLMVSSGGITHRLNRLQKAGLIERVPEPQDKRSLLVGLTEKGTRTAHDAFSENMALEK
jgi:DNA-binding MarR family transcriptional regulator